MPTKAPAERKLPRATSKPPTKDTDGTPFCTMCRKEGEQVRMQAAPLGSFREWECPRCTAYTYTEDMRLTYDQMVAGEPCRGCGQPLLVKGGSWVGQGTMYDTPEQAADRAAAQVAYRERHPHCRRGQWTMEGSAIAHCCRCCPMPPMSPGQIEKLRHLFRPVEDHNLAVWRFVLSCGHTVERTCHASYDDPVRAFTSSVHPCEECNMNRPAVSSEKLGPKGPPPHVPRPKPPMDQKVRERRIAKLRAELAELQQEGDE